MAKEMYQATGRRKSSIARVRLLPGTGRIVVNKKDLEDYFGLEVLKNEVKRNHRNNWKVRCNRTS